MLRAVRLAATLAFEIEPSTADLPGNTVLRANVRFSESESEAFPVASGGPLLSVSGLLEERDTREVSGGLQFHQATNERLDVEFLISHSHRWEELDSPAILPVQPRTESSDTWSRTQLSASARLLPFEPLEITLGGDIYWEAGGTDTTYFFPDDNVPSRFDLDRRVGGIFAEGLYQFPLGLNISASVRGDFPDEGKTEWSPAVGATLEGRTDNEYQRTETVTDFEWSAGAILDDEGGSPAAGRK